MSGQRSRSRILRERLYLETFANQTDVTNTTALNALVTKPLESTTATPTPATEGMDYEGSGFLDVFWKLTARLAAGHFLFPVLGYHSSRMILRSCAKMAYFHLAIPRILLLCFMF